MAKLILKDDHPSEDNALWFALRTNLPSYQLCFTLNEKLRIRLQRGNDILEEDNQAFATYLWRDKQTDESWLIICNKTWINQSIQDPTELFETNRKIVCLVSKQIDYLLRIDIPFGLNKTKGFIKKIKFIVGTKTYHPTMKIKQLVEETLSH